MTSFSQSRTLEQLNPHTGHDVAIQSPNITPINIQPLIPENAFLLGRQSPLDNVTEVVDAGARTTHLGNMSKRQLRPNTSSQRKTQPLFTTCLLGMLTDYNSPERKVSKQSDATRIKSLHKNAKRIVI